MAPGSVFNRPIFSLSMISASLTLIKWFRNLVSKDLFPKILMIFTSYIAGRLLLSISNNGLDRSFQL
jgi:hypothetical protein